MAKVKELRVHQSVNGTQPEEWLTEKELIARLNSFATSGNRQDNRASLGAYRREQRRKFKAKVRQQKRQRLQPVPKPGLVHSPEWLAVTKAVAALTAA